MFSFKITGQSVIVKIIFTCLLSFGKTTKHLKSVFIKTKFWKNKIIYAKKISGELLWNIFCLFLLFIIETIFLASWELYDDRVTAKFIQFSCLILLWKNICVFIIAVKRKGRIWSKILIYTEKMKILISHSTSRQFIIVTATLTSWNLINPQHLTLPYDNTSHIHIEGEIYLF